MVGYLRMVNDRSGLRIFEPEEFSIGQFSRDQDMARRTRKSRLAPAPSAAATADESTEDEGRLSRAWIKVAAESAAHGIELTQALISDTTQETGNSFWELVQQEYTKVGSKTPQVTADELCEQWSAVRVSLVEFLVPFVRLWVGSSISSQDAETSREKAFTAVQDAFRASHGYDFRHEVTTRLLIHHDMWEAVLKPLLIPTKLDEPMSPKTILPSLVDADISSPSDDEENRPMSPQTNELSGAEVGISRPRADEDNDPKTDKPSLVVAGTSRPRADQPTPARRVRQRLHTAADSDGAQHARVGDGVDAKKVELMERRLDLDVMTYSEEGLSAEAVEYLHLQRKQILRKAQELSG